MPPRPEQWRGFAVAPLVVAVLALLACAQPQRVPLPTLPPGPIEMRVVHVVNPRLPRMSPQQVDRLLAAVRDTACAHFGVELGFAPVREMPIAEAFARIPDAHRTRALEQVYDFKSGKGDRARLDRAFATGLQDSGESLASLAEFARPHVGELPGQSFAALGAAMAGLLQDCPIGSSPAMQAGTARLYY